MFGLFKRKPREPLNRLFYLSIHVRRGSNTDMAANIRGAFVPVFAGADHPESATTMAVSHLTEQGFEFVEIQNERLHELDPAKWDAYVGQAWPEFVSEFPTQDAVLDGLKSKLIFTGPYSSYGS